MRVCTILHQQLTRLNGWFAMTLPSFIGGRVGHVIVLERSTLVPGCHCQGSPETVTPPRAARTASRAQTRCSSPGIASRHCWTCSGCLPSRASRMTAASLCASVSRPCLSRITSKRGATQWSKANQLYLRPCWPASQVSVRARVSCHLPCALPSSSHVCQGCFWSGHIVCTPHI